MQKIFPFLQWLPAYSFKALPKDIIAGFTVGIVLIPQAMAYAMLAGISPVYGLYASLVPLVIYFFLGTSRPLAVGPVALDSLLVAIGLGALALSGDQYLSMAIFLAFLVGSIQLLLGLLRMGFMVNFLSKPVISAFTSAAAILIIFSQLKHLLGFEIERTSRFHEMILFLYRDLAATNLLDLSIGLAGILLIILLKKWLRRFPGILLAVVLAILAVYYLDLESKGVEIVGVIPHGFPSFQMPAFSMEAIGQLWPIAITLALVGYLEAISIAKGIEQKTGEDKLDPNKELVALGASNIAGSFFRSYPIAASFSRSYIADEAGSKSNFSGLFAAVLVLITLLFMTSLFYYLPNAVLASIIVVSVYRLIDLAYARRLWSLRKDEFAVWIITFLCTLFIGIIEGITTGAVLALLLMVYRTSNPHIAILGKIRNSDYYKNVERFSTDIDIRPDMLIIRFDAQLYFGNATYFKKQLFKCIRRKGKSLKVVILNAEAINYIDSTAAHMLKKLIKDVHSQQISFYIVGAIGPTRDILFSSGIADLLDKDHLLVRIQEAVNHFDSQETGSEITQKVARQSNKRP